MSDVYAVLVIFGVITGSFGPVDYSLKECIQRTQELNADLSAGETFEHKGKQLSYPDVFFDCVPSEDRPPLGIPFKDYLDQ